MRNTIKILETFDSLLESCTTPPYPTFRELARRMKVNPGDLDELIFRATGFSGDEIVDAYTSGAASNSWRNLKSFSK